MGVPAPHGTGRGRVVVALFACACLVAAMALYMLDPAESVLFARCPFLWTTGLYCPGCGTLRAIHHLLHGRLLTALSYNPLSVVLAPFVAYGVTAWAVGKWSGRRLPAPQLPAWVGWALLGVVLAFAVLRNIPDHPFRILAPGITAGGGPRCPRTAAPSPWGALPARSAPAGPRPQAEPVHRREEQ